MDSPGAVVSPIIQVGEGNVVISNPNILTAAIQSHRPMAQMAEQVIAKHADSLEISGRIETSRAEITALTITEENRFDYKVREKRITNETLLELKCNIYTFNTRTGNGRLDILGENPIKRNLPFKAMDLDPALFIKALSANHSTIIFTSEQMITALGETAIKKLYIHDIENHFYDLSSE